MGSVSAQKALQGSETETRELLGGMEVINIMKTEKNEFVTRPAKRGMAQSNGVHLRNCLGIPLSMRGSLVNPVPISDSSSNPPSLVVSHMELLRSERV